MLISQEATRLFLPSYAGINEVKSYSSGMDYAFPQSIFICSSCTGSIIKFPKTVQLQDRAGFPIEFSAVKEIL